jgi:hypothetical protein
MKPNFELFGVIIVLMAFWIWIMFIMGAFQ